MKKLKQLLGILIITSAIFATSCKKEECEVEKYGYFQFENKTHLVVFVWVDSKLVLSLSPYEKTAPLQTNSGKHTVYAETSDQQFFWDGERTVITCLPEKVIFQ